MSTEIRLAEDQMQQLMDNILAAGALLSSIDPKHTWSVVKFLKEDKPKSGPKQTECPTYDPKGYRKTLEAQIECLQSNLDAANDRALLARQENERLRAQIPKERLKVEVWYHVATGYSLHLLELKSLLICNLASREDAIRWAEERGLEVVE